MKIFEFSKKTAAVTLLILLTFVTNAQISSKKLIITGWDEPTSERLFASYKDFNSLPFDGTAIIVTAEGEPSNIGNRPFSSAFSNEQWNEAWFNSSINELKQVAQDSSRKLKDNFLQLNANPGNVDWFDDAGWAQITDHWRIAAKIAAECGLRGIIFDPEPYTKDASQFKVAAQPQHGLHTAEEYKKEARIRGQQVIDAVKSEDPTITILCYYAYNGVQWAESANGTPDIFAGQAYQLLPAFLNGWLDHASSQMTFIDGDEAAYHYNSDLDFLRAANQIRNRNQALVPPEDKAVYRAQFQVGFGLYLDAYLEPKGGPYAMDLGGDSIAGRLYSNLKSAMSAADQYVWIYGEQGRWWPKFHGSPEKPWLDIFQGIHSSIDAATSPKSFLDATKSQSQSQNMLKNNDFSQGNSNWSNWQAADSKGNFLISNGAKEDGVSNGCFIQSLPVKEGAFYAVTAAAKTSGTAIASIVVRWKDAEGNWTSLPNDVVIPATGSSAGVCSMDGIIEVPSGVASMVLLLSCNSEGNSGDSVTFTNAAVFGHLFDAGN